MSEKIPPKKVTATEFKNHQGSWLKKVVEGARLALTRRGKIVVSIEPAQASLPLGERFTSQGLQEKLIESVALVDADNLEVLVGVAKALGDKSIASSVETRQSERGGNLQQDVLRVSEKLDPEDLEKFVCIVRMYAKERLGKGKG